MRFLPDFYPTPCCRSCELPRRAPAAPQTLLVPRDPAWVPAQGSCVAESRSRVWLCPCSAVGELLQPLRLGSFMGRTARQGKNNFFLCFAGYFFPLIFFSQCSHKSSKMWYNWNLFSLTVGKVVSVLLNLNPLADAKPTKPFPFYFKAMLLILVSGVTDTRDIFGRHCLGFFDL